MTEERMALVELLQKSGDGDFLRSVAESVLQILMETDVEGLIGAGRHERTGERLNYRNGYRDRSLDTRLGSLQLRIPKLTGPHEVVRAPNFFSGRGAPIGRGGLSPPKMGIFPTGDQPSIDFYPQTHAAGTCRAGGLADPVLLDAGAIDEKVHGRKCEDLAVGRLQQAGMSSRLISRVASWGAIHAAVSGHLCGSHSVKARSPDLVHFENRCCARVAWNFQEAPVKLGKPRFPATSACNGNPPT